MVALLPSPEQQFCDAAGAPYAGGTLATYQPGTTTPVTTWNEPTGTVANTNPIVLDAAGRCIVYASGAVRMVLQDANGNTIFDQPSSTLVSAAMAPVCIAPDIATAQGLLGIQNNSTALATLTAGLAAETTRAEAAEAALTTALAAETTRAEAAEAGLGGLTVKCGSGTLNSAGYALITYPTPFPTETIAFNVNALGSGVGGGCIPVVNPTRYGAAVWCGNTANAPLPGLSFCWIAIGS